MNSNIKFKPKKSEESIQEKYNRIGARYPWLHPLEKPVSKGSAKFKRLYHIRKPGLRIEGLHKLPHISHIEHFHNIKHNVLKDNFLDKAHANLEAFPKMQYTHTLANELKNREKYFVDVENVTPPLRDLIDIQNPSQHSVSVVSSMHTLNSIPFYHIAKGYDVSVNADGTFSVSNQTTIGGSSRLGSAGDLIEVLMYRRGYREKFNENPDAEIVSAELEKENPQFEDLVKLGVLSIIRDMLSIAKEKGWKPGKLNNDLYENPLHLAFVQSADVSNQIPFAFANMLEKYGKGYIVVDDEFTKINLDKRTGTDNESRLFNQPRFEGNVVSDGYYAILDDIMVTGATLMNLGGLITAKGGTVSSYHVLASPKQGFDIVPTEPINDIRKSEYTEVLNNELNITNKVIDKIEESAKSDASMLGLLQQHKDAKQKIENKLCNLNSNSSYEKELSCLLHTKGHDILENAIKNKIGLTFLTMNYQELKTINQLLKYIDDKPSKKLYNEFAPYIVADIINDPDFDLKRLQSKGISPTQTPLTFKNIIEDYKNQNNDDYIKNLPLKLLKNIS